MLNNIKRDSKFGLTINFVDMEHSVFRLIHVPIYVNLFNILFDIRSSVDVASLPKPTSSEPSEARLVLY